MVKITNLHTNPRVGASEWERVYQVEHTDSGMSFYIHTSLGYTCAFNMMSHVDHRFYREDYCNPTVVEEIRAALFTYFHENWPRTGHRFTIGELFWCVGAPWKQRIAPHLEHVFDWRSASEPGRDTAMYKFNLRPKETK